ncbi:MAG: enoyl-CoA hydratase/isomerase family protein [Sphaerobacter sp.]|nr:enoyl-CoA hydratase/isomerase family protein [Sphaerobacter sp.]
MRCDDDAPVQLAFDGDRATLTLNRPRSRNAADRGMLEGLIAAADQLDARRPRVVLLRGAGPAFCAGIDLKAMQAASAAETRHLVATMHRALGALRALTVPLVALIQGACVGLGVELALSADLRIAAPSARFSYREPAVAIPSPTWRVTQVIGLARAQDLLLTARWVDADEAAALGLVTRVADDLDAAARAVADQIAALAPLAVAETKRNLLLTLEDGAAAATRHHLDAVVAARATEDGREALAAFAEKRAPCYVGR